MAQGGYYDYSLARCDYPHPYYIYNSDGYILGVDYKVKEKNRGISFYKFIEDMNKANGDTYYNKFEPTEHILNETNQFGI